MTDLPSVDYIMRLVDEFACLVSDRHTVKAFDQKRAALRAAIERLAGQAASVDLKQVPIQSLMAELQRRDEANERWKDGCSSFGSEEQAASAEPVAWIREWDGDESDLGQFVIVGAKDEIDDVPGWFPVYAAPQPAVSAEPVASIRWPNEIMWIKNPPPSGWVTVVATEK